MSSITVAKEEKSGVKQWIVLGIVLIVLFGMLAVLAQLGNKTLASDGLLWGIGLGGGFALMQIFALIMRRGNRSKESLKLRISSWFWSTLIGTAVFAPIVAAAFILVNYLGASNAEAKTYPIDKVLQSTKKGKKSYEVEFVHKSQTHRVKVGDNAYAARNVDLKIAKGLFGIDVVKEASTNLGITIKQ
jgi:hypothetical protein